MSARAKKRQPRPDPEPGSSPSGPDIEEHLRHVQRLVMQGELAATAVHEISNLLTIVMFNAGLLRIRHPDDPNVLKYVEPLLHASNVIGSLCSQLRNLSRPSPAHLRVIDLAETARRSFTLLDQIMQRDLTLEAEGREPVLISADPSHIDQIVINLVLNARDATSDTDGRIGIRVGYLPEGGAPYLEVKDNGSGMTPEVQRQVFKAFFTTKPLGQGTGLGLATVQRLVAGMGGEIKLTSNPGAGTAIRLLFPAPSAEDVAYYRAMTVETPPPAPN